MDTSSINLNEKLSLFSDLWSPKTIAGLNDYRIKLVKMLGPFVWHRHGDTDEMFLCLHGELDIELRDGVVRLREGDLFVVPKGAEHKPFAARECHVLLVEPKGVVNTGGAKSGLTAPIDQWI
jgi:mannose-6-phosphate isomerase-like protein (cupin superfamily)